MDKNKKKCFAAMQKLAAVLLVLFLGFVAGIGTLDVMASDGLIDDIRDEIAADVLPPQSAVTGLTVSSASIDSLTLSWTKAGGTPTYVLAYWESGKPGTKIELDVGDVSSYTVHNLKPCKYQFYVYSANYKHDGSLRKGASAGVAGAPMPDKPAAVRLNNVKKGYCSVYIDGLNADNSYIYRTQVQLLDMNRQQLAAGIGDAAGASIDSAQIKNNSFYYVRARGFFEKKDGGKIYGEWSDSLLFGVQLAPVKMAQKNGKLTVRWQKVEGASSYTVYISRRASGGYHRAAVVRTENATVKSCAGKKLVSGKTYYIKVKAAANQDGARAVCGSEAVKITLR